MFTHRNIVKSVFGKLIAFPTYVPWTRSLPLFERGGASMRRLRAPLPTYMQRKRV